MKTYVTEALLMSTHNIFFLCVCGEIRKYYVATPSQVKFFNQNVLIFFLTLHEHLHCGSH